VPPDLSPRMTQETAITLSDLISDVEDARLAGDGSVEIDQLEYDSRLIKRPALFFAVKGFKVDGYDYVEQARTNGAIAVMGERESCEGIANHVTVNDIRAAMATTAARFYGYPGHRIKACGVTGTNGKSTVCFLIKSILEARGKRAGLISSVIYDTGSQTFPAERTTPESLDIQRLLYLMKTAWCVNAVVEVSSHALELHRVDHIDFRTAVYTNLTRDHLDFHQTMEEYFKAKAKLAQRLEGDLSFAVINLDEEAWRPLFGELKCSHMTYSMQDESADVEFSFAGTVQSPECAGGRRRRTGLRGRSGQYGDRTGKSRSRAGAAQSRELWSAVCPLCRFRSHAGRHIPAVPGGS
jgi:UDP-N-acetylmuramoyl-L-alanyl-D-glutamate--2,6-diaminopimelate ligase